ARRDILFPPSASERILAFLPWFVFSWRFRRSYRVWWHREFWCRYLLMHVDRTLEIVSKRIRHRFVPFWELYRPCGSHRLAHSAADLDTSSCQLHLRFASSPQRSERELLH